MAAMRMRQAKILFRDTLESVIDPDPSGGLPGSAASAMASASKGRYPLVYKCKKCRRTLATAFNLLPHIQDESPNWTASKWSLPAEDVLEAASENGLRLCSGNFCRIVLAQIDKCYTNHDSKKLFLIFFKLKFVYVHIFKFLLE